MWKSSDMSECLNKSWNVRTGWKGTSQDQLRGGKEKAGQVRKEQDKSESKARAGQIQIKS